MPRQAGFFSNPGRVSWKSDRFSCAAVAGEGERKRGEKGKAEDGNGVARLQATGFLAEREAAAPPAERRHGGDGTRCNQR